MNNRNTIKPIKHYRSQQVDEPGQPTKYIAPCKATGTDHKQFTTELSAVSCVHCWASLKVKRAAR